MNPSPESLQAFAQAVAQGSFSAAARRLGKSQSTVSEAIARLEIDLGVTLFDRSGRQPRLTEAGQVLAGRVEQVLAASDRLQRVAAELAGGREARVTLGLSDAYQSAGYEALLAEMAERYPDLEFECLLAEREDLIELVDEGRATLALLAAREHYAPELGWSTVAERAEFALFVGQDHPLARLPRVGVEDLANWRLLALSTVGQPEARDDALPAGDGRWTAPNYLLLLEMAVHGFGWAELPRWLVDGYAGGRLRELKVTGWPRTQAVDIIWSRRRPLGPAASWMLERLLAQSP